MGLYGNLSPFRISSVIITSVHCAVVSFSHFIGESLVPRNAMLDVFALFLTYTPLRK